MQIDERLAQRGKFGVSAAHFEVASPDRVGDVTAAALGVLASVDNVDLEVGVFVQDLLYSAVVAALLRLHLVPALLFTSLVVFVQLFVIHVV